MKHDQSTDIIEGLPPVQPRPASPSANEPTMLQIIIAWEKLRFFYNILMVGVYCIYLARIVESGGLFPPAGAIFGCGGIYLLIVNVPFCLCHVFEVYFCWLGMQRTVARAGIFVIVTGAIGGGLTTLAFLK